MIALDCPLIILNKQNTSGIRQHVPTCADESRLVPVRLRRVSLWHTVRSEDGRIERKSLKDLRRTPSVSSVTHRACGESLGNNLDNRASSVWL